PCGRRASHCPPPVRPARPTTTPTPGSSGTRRSSWPGSGWATTSSSASSSTTQGAGRSSHPPGRRSCATCTTAVPHPRPWRGPIRCVPEPPAPGAHVLEFPDAVLVPGLVNTHTHLELTHLAGRNSEPEFARWIRTIRALKDATPPDEFTRSAERGVRDCWAAGVTCVADTGSTGAVMHALHALGGRGICYQEVFGPDPAQARTSLAEPE